MGVQDLWSIIEPVRESVPLYSLSGKTLAVDLSLWVCEAQHVQAMVGIVIKPYLRNLFFRVSSLTLMGLKLVFVMEGEPPKIKADTMSKRTEARYGFKKAPVKKSTSNPSRGRFNAVLRECAEMLDYMGVPWVKAAGEAEAMCAFLDSQGLVDGCITNDGDAFLYGARTVYRNFNMNSKDPQVECYRTSRVQTELHLCRENLVGLGILLGCDYIPKGISGVGREHVLKLIQMLKGQSLLQRFNQWKEETPGVFEETVKKVAHCHLCRHPGSAKAHERGGCVLCNSEHFCQPQDYDYQCPCDWHRYEKTRQDLSHEAKIRKKTLENPKFPFEEIIHEFLVSKDKPVSQFQRRQPNMLLMQKFTLKKMEWPKHYTSEKVLVLMTYAELMNRKYGRESSPQIRPLRIVKPRVRNAVACFEVIWSTPEHFVFPEDRPAEEQHEVRTVEEESLFRVAFPEVVERYLRDKAQAEENKTKKKRKPKSKKEKKAADLSEGISDLMAQMTLQTHSNAPTQALPPTVSHPEEPEVLILNTPVKHEPEQKPEEDHCPKTPLIHSESETVPSPSVCAVIAALHLSNINWDASSFSASPTPQSAPQTNHNDTPELSKADKKDRDGEEKEDEKNKKDLEESDFTFTPESCPLRERVLLRNTIKELAPLKLIPSNNPISSNQIPIKVCGDDKVCGKKEPIPATNMSKTATYSSKQQLKSTTQTQNKPKESCNDSKKPHQKYKFVKKTILSSVVSPQKCGSDQRQCSKDKKVPEMTKRSVCRSVCSSSEESDTENQQSGPQMKAKSKTVNKTKSSKLLDAPLKPVCRPKMARNAASVQKQKSHSVDVEVQSAPTPTESKFPDVSPANVVSPASPVTLSESDDSVFCSESPLPLAERLKLKFLK